MRKFNFLFAALVAIALATPAFATSNQDHSCQTPGSCSGDSSATSSSNASANASAIGQGFGGAGGQGGNATAFGGNASATGGSVNHSGNSSSSSGVFNSGNSSNHNTNVNVVPIGNGIGNFSPSSSSSSSSSVGPISNEQGQGQEQGQSQTAVGKVKTNVSVEGSTLIAEGDTTNYEAPEIPVNSAAPVFAGACSQGVSVQTQSFGASAGSTNPVCDYVAVAGGLVASGERGEALRVLGKAEKAADFRYNIYRVRAILTLGLL